MSKYEKLLEFHSIQKYLKKAIGSKKTDVASSKSLDKKLEEVSLPNYLRGIYLFFKFSEKFNNPSEIIDFFEKNRSNTKKLDEIEEEIYSFMSWLSEKYSSSTASKYYYNICGFLSNNNIIFKWKKYKPKTKKHKNQKKFGFQTEEKKKFASKVKEFIKDQELRTLIEFLHRTGLSWDTISSFTFGELRIRELNETKYIPIQKTRRKTSVDFYNFLSPKLQEYLNAHLRLNEDKKDSDKIFGNKKKYAYNRLLKKYRRAYKKCVKAYFPKLLEIKTNAGNLKTIFGFHDFRSLFISIATTLHIDNYYKDILTAHKQKSINGKHYDSISGELLEVYKAIEAELFGNQSKSEEGIKKELIGDLLDLIENSGKRKALFKKYNEDKSIDVDYQLQIALFLEKFKQQILTNVRKEVSNELNGMIKDKITNLRLRDVLTSS